MSLNVKKYLYKNISIENINNKICFCVCYVVYGYNFRYIEC